MARIPSSQPGNSRSALFAGKGESRASIWGRSLRNALLASAETKEKRTKLYGGLISEKRVEINGLRDRFGTLHF